MSAPTLKTHATGARKLIRELEFKVVLLFVEDALSAGYTLSVSLERGWDKEDMLLGSTDAEKIMDEAFAGDEAHIFIHAPGAAPLVDGRVNDEGYVYVVFGNDGWDVICDYSGNQLTESLLTRANALADTYQG